MVGTKMKFNWKDGVKLLAGILILAYVIYSTGVENIFEAILQIKVEFLALAIFFYFLLDLVLSHRVYLTLKWLDYDVKWKDVFWSHLFGMFLSNFTPGRVGYVGITQNLKKKLDVPISKSMSAIGIIQSIDFLVKSFGALLGILFIVGVIGNGQISNLEMGGFSISGNDVINLGLIGVLVVFVLGVSFLIMMWMEVDFAINLVKKIPFLGSFFSGFIDDMKSPSIKLRGKSHIMTGYGILSWIIRGFEWMAIGYACNMFLPFMTFFLLHPLLTSIRYVPATPAGIGLFEGVTLVGFSIFGIPPANALLFSFFDRIDNVVVDSFALREFKYI
jgi:uncharacterized membrane protein YbhN (UPF0104 family)